MVKITILCVGKIKEKFFKEAIGEYRKRLSKYCQLNILEIPDVPLPSKLNKSIEEQIKKKECAALLAHIPKDSFSISLDLTGKEFSSEELASSIAHWQLQESHLCFIIGGSLGFTDELKKQVKSSICFSKMTFPHQLIRVFLLEQLFRSFKILNNETYHK